MATDNQFPDGAAGRLEALAIGFLDKAAAAARRGDQKAADLARCLARTRGECAIAERIRGAIAEGDTSIADAARRLRANSIVTAAAAEELAAFDRHGIKLHPMALEALAASKRANALAGVGERPDAMDRLAERSGFQSRMHAARVVVEHGAGDSQAAAEHAAKSRAAAASLAAALWGDAATKLELAGRTSEASAARSKAGECRAAYDEARAKAVSLEAREAVAPSGKADAEERMASRIRAATGNAEGIARGNSHLEAAIAKLGAADPSAAHAQAEMANEAASRHFRIYEGLVRETSAAAMAGDTARAESLAGQAKAFRLASEALAEQQAAVIERALGNTRHADMISALADHANERAAALAEKAGRPIPSLSGKHAAISGAFAGESEAAEAPRKRPTMAGPPCSSRAMEAEAEAVMS